MINFTVPFTHQTAMHESVDLGQKNIWQGHNDESSRLIYAGEYRKISYLNTTDPNVIYGEELPAGNSNLNE